MTSSLDVARWRSHLQHSELHVLVLYEFASRAACMAFRKCSTEHLVTLNFTSSFYLTKSQIKPRSIRQIDRSLIDPI